MSEPLQISIGAAVATQQTVDLPLGRNKLTSQEIKLVIPDTTNGVTFTFAILDKQGVTRYSIAGLVDNSPHILLVERAIRPGYKYGITPSGVTGNDIVCSIYPDYLEG